MESLSGPRQYAPQFDCGGLSQRRTLCCEPLPHDRVQEPEVYQDDQLPSSNSIKVYKCKFEIL